MMKNQLVLACYKNVIYSMAWHGGLTRLFFPAPQTKSLMNDNYKYSDGLRPEIYQMLDQQIILGNTLGIKDFFISREDKKPLIIKNNF